MARCVCSLLKVYCQFVRMRSETASTEVRVRLQSIHVQRFCSYHPSKVSTSTKSTTSKFQDLSCDIFRVGHLVRITDDAMTNKQLCAWTKWQQTISFCSVRWLYLNMIHRWPRSYGICTYNLVGSYRFYIIQGMFGWYVKLREFQ